MYEFTPSYLKAVEELHQLPGIGPKSAEKLAASFLKMKQEDFHGFVEALQELREKVKQCSRCYNLAESELCLICSDPERDQTKLCVVEESKDLVAIEKTGAYNGLYHVLQGVLKPIEGIQSNKIRLKELFHRLQHESFQEIILATNFNYEGELTAMYIVKELKNSSLTISRLASGLPMGSDIEFADQLTLKNAFRGREKFSEEMI
ncbi:recombination mediator RecR [bacterium]|nr:recombination mediator RecR [bacterium]